MLPGISPPPPPSSIFSYLQSVTPSPNHLFSHSVRVLSLCIFPYCQNVTSTPIYFPIPSECYLLPPPSIFPYFQSVTSPPSLFPYRQSVTSPPPPISFPIPSECYPLPHLFSHPVRVLPPLTHLFSDPLRVLPPIYFPISSECYLPPPPIYFPIPSECYLRSYYSQSIRTLLQFDEVLLLSRLSYCEVKEIDAKQIPAIHISSHQEETINYIALNITDYKLCLYLCIMFVHCCLYFFSITKLLHS